METIRLRAVLTDVLLRTLAEAKDGLSIQGAYEVIDASYEFPEEWYRQLPESPGYDELRQMGFADWRTIPQEQLVEVVRTEPQWQNEIRWSRNDLRKLGYLDVLAPRGTWRLTDAGFAAAASHAATTLTPAERKIATPKVRKKTRQRGKKSAPSLATSRPSRREDLLSKLDLLVHGLPISELDLVVNMARLIRRRVIVDDAVTFEAKT